MDSRKLPARGDYPYQAISHSHSRTHKKRRQAEHRLARRVIEERGVYSKGNSDNEPRFAHEASAMVRCPDCEYREALDNVGMPKRREGDREPLRPVSHRVPRAPHRSRGCVTCGGTGQIENPEGAIDPYSRDVRLTQGEAARMAKRLAAQTSPS